MAQYFKKYQNNVRDSKMFGKWYGRAVTLRTVEVEELAAQMQDNCTVKRADILAVLSELGPTMKQLMQNSLAVRIPYLGVFKIVMATKPAEEKAKFDVSCVKNLKVNFRPEAHKLEQSGKRVKDLVAGSKVTDIENYIKTANNDGNGENNG